MKDMDYEEILNYISLILALVILIIILYRYFFNSQIENFETEKVKAEGKRITWANIMQAVKVPQETRLYVNEVLNKQVEA